MSPKLFTASDVERAARLAAAYAANEVIAKRERGEAWRDVEAAVAHGLATVADDAPPFYSEDEVKQMLQYLLTKEDVEAEFEDALNMVRR